jgi:hypothetical protein
MSRGVFLLGIGIALVAMAFALTDWILGPRPGVTEANVRRIRMGMTLEEVEAILGKDYWPSGGCSTIHFSMSECQWRGPDGVASVWFESSSRDPRRVVSSARFLRTELRSPFQRLRDWFGW